MYGEEAQLLLPVLADLFATLEPIGDGTSHVELGGGQEMEPFFRALMRAEADLLLQDADRVGGPQERRRTWDNRRHDALVEVVERTLAVLRVSHRDVAGRRAFQALRPNMADVDLRR